jgi:hypothetical protein
MAQVYLKNLFICYISNKIFTEGRNMKIQKGKIAIALLVLILVFPAGKMVGSLLEERAKNRCTASTPGDPQASMDFSASVDLNFDTLSWVCHRDFTDAKGEPNGLASTLTFPLIP